MANEFSKTSFPGQEISARKFPVL